MNMGRSNHLKVWHVTTQAQLPQRDPLAHSNREEFHWRSTTHARGPLVSTTWIPPPKSTPIQSPLQCRRGARGVVGLISYTGLKFASMIRVLSWIQSPFADVHSSEGDLLRLTGLLWAFSPGNIYPVGHRP